MAKMGNSWLTERDRHLEVGRSEVLTVRVNLLDTITSPNADGTMRVEIPFDGRAESPWFAGKVVTPASDIQRHRNGETIEACADYILEGTDFRGTKCKVHVTNTLYPDGWKPVVSADCGALTVLNDAQCHTVVEPADSGVIIHIFCERRILPDP